MLVKTFVSKITVDALHEMDRSISDWIERNKVEIKFVNQTLGDEKGHDGRQAESVMVTSVWYVGSQD